MKFLIICGIIVLIYSCKQGNNKFIKSIPDIKSVIFSEKCDRIIYATNTNNLFRTSYIEGYFSNRPKIIQDININDEYDIFPQSVSCDCQFTALTGKNIMLFNNYTHEVFKLQDKDKNDYKLPYFSPIKPELAFLSDSGLQIYNYQTKEKLITAQPAHTNFKSITWSVKGTYIYLEDDETNIWRYERNYDSFILLWEAPYATTTSRMITPSEKDEKEIYFVSDHESDFTQIYKYKQGKTQQITYSDYDHYLFLNPVKADTLYYKSNQNGFHILEQYTNGISKKVFQNKGVVLSFYPYKSGGIAYYSDHNNPLNIYSLKNEVLKPLLPGLIDSMPEPKTYTNKYGLHHLIYFPNSPPKGWIAWVHGGPQTQMLNRHNILLSHFLKLGWGMIVLNYLGSTGYGNTLEMRGDKELIEKEISNIREDLISIKKKYPEINKMAMIGVSYGAGLVHGYTQLYNDITHVVDFSGAGAIPAKSGIPILYVYGQYDSALKDTARVSMIENDISKRNGSRIIIKGSGHNIIRRLDVDSALNGISNFLNEH